MGTTEVDSLVVDAKVKKLLVRDSELERKGQTLVNNWEVIRGTMSHGFQSMVRVECLAITKEVGLGLENPCGLQIKISTVFCCSF